jgi:hypothetical protein
VFHLPTAVQKSAHASGEYGKIVDCSRNAAPLERIEWR